jgi:hypothetical protein
MFNSWMFYIIFGLSATVGALGWLSLSLHDDKVVAVEALVQAINVNSDMQKSLNLKDLSCQIDSESGAELVSEKNKIDEGISPVNSQLKDLATVKKVISKVVTVVAAKQETTKNESNFLPDDGLLSPSVTRLLRNGWCSVYPDSDQCVSPGQSVGKPL